LEIYIINVITDSHS